MSPSSRSGRARDACARYTLSSSAAALIASSSPVGLAKRTLSSALPDRFCGCCEGSSDLGAGAGAGQLGASARERAGE